MGVKARQLQMIAKELGSPRKYKEGIRAKLGIRHDEATGKNYIDKDKREMGTDEFSIEDLARTFLGHDSVSEWCNGLPSHKASVMAAALSETYQERVFVEDYAPQTASVFQDINAWNATIGGLIEARVLESYRTPAYICEQFMTTKPTVVDGGKIIGIPAPSPSGDVVEDGVEIPNIGMNELWVFKRPNIVFGEKLSVTRQAVVYDIGGELLQKAESLGLGLGYAKEYYCASQILGLKNLVPASGFPKQKLLNQIGDSFRMNQTIDSTPNPTYQQAGVTTNPNLKHAYDYINQLTGGPLVDWTTLNAVRKLLYLMKDPVYQINIDAALNKIWIDPFAFDNLLRIRTATGVTNVTGTANASYGPLVQAGGSTFPPVVTENKGFPDGSWLTNWTPHTSAIWHQCLLDSGVSEANAEKYAVAGDPDKAFQWASLWDTDVKTANPTSADLMSRMIVNLWVGSWAGQFVVVEPRYVVQMTN